MPISDFSYMTVPVSIVGSTGKTLSRATAFFYDPNTIVTNWHVVTGRDPAKPSFSQSGAIPTHMKVRLHVRVTRSDGQPAISLKNSKEITIDINSKDGNEPHWFEHHSFRYRVDVVAIKVPNPDELNARYAFKDLAGLNNLLTDEYQPEVMDDVFIVGYPWGLTGGGDVFPLFKRGSIASEPLVNKTDFLIDCRTTHGMSGAPVLASHSGIWSPDGRLQDGPEFGTFTNFAGVYSGRLLAKDNSQDDEHQDDGQSDAITEIGKVWQATVVDEIVSSGVSGTPLTDLV